MKRAICLMLLAVCMVSLLTACGIKNCDKCGKLLLDGGNKTYDPNSEVLRTIYVCDDCYDDMFYRFAADQTMLGEWVTGE